MHYGALILSPQVHYFYENSSKVSGRFRKYSRFWETSGRDFFDVDCDLEAAVDAESLNGAFDRPRTQAKQLVSQNAPIEH